MTFENGHVSPQYHCMFDDLFQTVFCEGENDVVVEEITSLSWDNARELHAEDEFDDDGVSVYQPPPLKIVA